MMLKKFLSQFILTMGFVTAIVLTVATVIFAIISLFILPPLDVVKAWVASIVIVSFFNLDDIELWVYERSSRSLTV